MLSSSPNTLICSVLPLVDKKPSPQQNRIGASEFIVHRGRQMANPQLWSGQRQYFTTRDGETLVLMDVAAYIPPCFLHASQLSEYDEARDWFNQHGCGIGNYYVTLTMYKKYSQVLLSIMNSPIVQAGRMRGWRPLIMFQNVLCAKSRFGVRGMHFTSVDKGAK